MPFDGRHLVVCYTVAAVSLLAGFVFGWIAKDDHDADKH